MWFKSIFVSYHSRSLSHAKSFRRFKMYRSEYDDGLIQAKVVDFRSDTLSLPTQSMREAIYRAEVGDSVYEEDPSVTALEKLSAKLFQKEAACFVSSGTMANLAAILVHCEKRSSEIITGHKSHILLFEQTGVAQFGGINIREIENKPDGTFDIEQLKLKIRQENNYTPVTRLICVENTHNVLGGKVLSPKWIKKVSDVAKYYKIPLHMDGARIFNAAVKLRIPVCDIARDMDSVCFCLSKSLGAPYGSVLVGSAEFVCKAKRAVKALGGGVRQIGFMAAAGLYALENMVSRLQDDHDAVQKIANAIRESKNPNITVPEAKDIHSNMLLVHVNRSKLTPDDLLYRLSTVSEYEEDPVIIKAFSLDEDCIRFVICCNNTKSDVDDAIHKIRLVIREFI